MQDILVLSTDDIYARMLELELRVITPEVSAARGLKLARPMPDPEAGRIVVADFDTLSTEDIITLFQYGPPSYVYWFSRFPMPKTLAITQKNWMERPMRMSKMIERVRHMCLYREESEEAPYELLFVADQCAVRYGEKTILLTGREYDLLQYLYDHKGTPVSREEAVQNVWKYDYTGNTNIVDVYIRYLREKVDELIGQKLIYTIRNKGYMFRDDQLYK